MNFIKQIKKVSTTIASVTTFVLSCAEVCTAANVGNLIITTCCQTDNCNSSAKLKLSVVLMLISLVFGYYLH